MLVSSETIVLHKFGNKVANCDKQGAGEITFLLCKNEVKGVKSLGWHGFWECRPPAVNFRANEKGCFIVLLFSCSGEYD